MQHTLMRYGWIARDTVNVRMEGLGFGHDL